MLEFSGEKNDTSFKMAVVTWKISGIMNVCIVPPHRRAGPVLYRICTRILRFGASPGGPKRRGDGKHEHSGYQRWQLFPEVSAAEPRDRRSAGQGPVRADRHRRQVHLQAPGGGQAGAGRRRRGHAHSLRGHPGRSERPGGQGQRRHRLHAGDRRGGSPGGPRRRGLRRLRPDHGRGHEGPGGVHPPGSPPQPCQHHRHQRLHRRHGQGRAPGGRIRHRLPPDHARQGLYVRPALRVL